MLPEIEADAPGKLVIVGEYAALAGAPALAVAVDVRARVRLGPPPGSGSQMVIPEIGQAFAFRWVPESGLRWEGKSPGAWGLPLEACVAVLIAARRWPRAGEVPACRIELGTAAFHHTDDRGERSKLGLGSSAAVVAALMAVLLRLAGGAAPGRQALIDLSCAAHRHLQRGAGSGIDVATAITGGTVSLDFPAAVAGKAGNPRAHPVSWPRHLYLLPVWTGQSAFTPAMLNRLQQYQGRQPAGSAANLERLAAIGLQAVVAWRAGDVPGILQAVSSYEAGLRRLDEAAGIGIFSPAHERLRALAMELGAVYKPSGAGGGDFGILLTGSRSVRLRAEVAFRAAGFSCLNAALCAPGLVVHSEPDHKPAVPGTPAAV